MGGGGGVAEVPLMSPRGRWQPLFPGTQPWPDLPPVSVSGPETGTR